MIYNFTDLDSLVRSISPFIGPADALHRGPDPSWSMKDRSHTRYLAQDHLVVGESKLLVGQISVLTNDVDVLDEGVGFIARHPHDDC